MSQDLVDPFGRTIRYVRLSVTDRCDLRCAYCMPKGFKGFSEPDSWLTFPEITRAVNAFARNGVRHVRITGGEPLVRHKLPDLVAALAELSGVEDLSLSTNAVRLASHAGPLRKAGLHRVNVSLDSLDAERFKEITGGGRLEKVIAGLMAAKAEGLTPIKLNMVVMGGVNDHEVESVVDFCAEHGFTLRLIETMPMGSTGLTAVGQYVSLQDIRERLARRYTLIPAVSRGAGPARYVQVAGTELRIGFITPISQHFCQTCNRVRMAVDGTVYLCLGQEHKYAMRPLLRSGATEAALDEAVRKAILLKPERHEFTEKPQQIVRFMSMTGG